MSGRALHGAGTGVQAQAACLLLSCHLLTCSMKNSLQCRLFFMEAPGIEPGSRDASAPASTCVVAVCFSPRRPAATRSGRGKPARMSPSGNRATPDR